MSLWTINEADGTLSYHLHRGQSRAHHSQRRFVVVLAGTQGGKTSYGPIWLDREIYGDNRRQGCGAGGYIAATASYDLFKLKMLPSLREHFEHHLGIGRYWSGDRIIELAPEPGQFWARRADDSMWARIILRSAESPGGLESATAKAAWLDEADQDSFTLEVWEAILRRLSLARGRVLITTTIYAWAWIKAQLYDRWKAGDTDIEVVQFDSILNPSFPRAEFDDRRDKMQVWKFNRTYRGLADKPAGLISDSFKDYSVLDGGHLCKR